MIPVSPLSIMEAQASHQKALQALISQHATQIGRTRMAQIKVPQSSPAIAPDSVLDGSFFDHWRAYLVDAQQRSILTLDTLRQRGNLFLAHNQAGSPPVLDFAYEIIVDGMILPRPANYSLVKVTPPNGVLVDPKKRPFMIIDPRAGHGAGIGGFKPESQVGEAFEEGHAVYFVIFRPNPAPGQTLADVRDAEEAFLDEIARRHPEAEKPVVIGNCQGGWASMMLAAHAPEKTGPIAINGAPMAYWAGESGQNPMRYLGGLAGGVVPALIYSDLGNGVFDGSLLVQNFESLNPANTYWKKLYALYANVDTEAERFLEFEGWWGGFFMMNEAEIRWIVENLFVGNRLSHGQAILGGQAVDLKAIRSPIVVFASHGDNITPPPQALNWIPDLYRDVNEIKVLGQRIVYLLHDSVGHLGIFVSAKVAGREHQAITDTMSAIEALPPGLYEMVLDPQPDRMHIKFAPRTIEDILSLDDGRKDEEMFAAVAKFSELGAQVYDMFIRPGLKRMVTDSTAQRFFQSRPLRRERVMFSDQNPFMGWVGPKAEEIRAQRQTVDAQNPFVGLEHAVSAAIEQNLNFYRDIRDAMQEITFHAVYGSPLMRMIGESGLQQRDANRAQNLLAMPQVREALAKIESGGEAEAIIRMLELLSNARGYVRRSRMERMLELFASEAPFRTLDETSLAALIHQQALIVQFAPEAAQTSLPVLLKTDAARKDALDVVMRIAGPEETMHKDVLALYRSFEALLELPPVNKTEAQPA